MFILDIFGFKDKFKEIFNKDNLILFVQYIKEQIIEQIQKKIPGQEKMDIVVDKLLDFVNKHLHSDNKIVQFIIDTFIVNNIRTICQTIYDTLKQVVEGL